MTPPDGIEIVTYSNDCTTMASGLVVDESENLSRGTFLIFPCMEYENIRHKISHSIYHMDCEYENSAECAKDLGSHLVAYSRRSRCWKHFDADKKTLITSYKAIGRCVV